MICVYVYDSFMKGKPAYGQNFAHCVDRNILLYLPCALTVAY